MAKFHKHSESCLGGIRKCPDCKGLVNFDLHEDDDGFCERCSNCGVLETWACRNIFERIYHKVTLEASRNG